MEDEKIITNFEGLVIEPQLQQIPLKEDALPLNLNPFYRESESSENTKKKLQIFGNCHCTRPKFLKNTQFKRRKKPSILKEPVLKDVARCICKRSGHDIMPDELLSYGASPFKESQQQQQTRILGASKDDIHLDFRTLEISDSSSSCSSWSDDELYTRQSFKKFRTRKSLKQITTKEQQQQQHQSVEPTASTSTGTCSVQARMNPNQACDITIYELSGYFDELVSIPKKMSKQAESMYI